MGMYGLICLPDNGVCGHDELWFSSGRIVEEFTLCLHKYMAVVVQFEAIHARRIGTIL